MKCSACREGVCSIWRLVAAACGSDGIVLHAPPQATPPRTWPCCSCRRRQRCCPTSSPSGWAPAPAWWWAKRWGAARGEGSGLACLQGRAGRGAAAASTMRARQAALSGSARWPQPVACAPLQVFAIGNPFGLDHSLSSGIISGLNRELSTGAPPLPLQKREDRGEGGCAAGSEEHACMQNAQSRSCLGSNGAGYGGSNLRNVIQVGGSRFLQCSSRDQPGMER